MSVVDVDFLLQEKSRKVKRFVAMFVENALLSKETLVQSGAT